MQGIVKSVMFWFQSWNVGFLSGTEEDFKFWSSDFLLHFKNERGNSKETGCRCATDSQSGGNAGCHSQEDSQKNGGQGDEVLCRII